MQLSEKFGKKWWKTSIFEELAGCKKVFKESFSED